jgi:hypothetical protein
LMSTRRRNKNTWNVKRFGLWLMITGMMTGVGERH